MGSSSSTLGRREVVHIGVTSSPSAQYAAQSFIEALCARDNRVPRFLIRDRDSIYGAEFRRRVRSCGTRCLLTPPRSPQANSYCERIVGTLRRECLDHVIVLDERHAERVLREFVRYYHGRPHRGLRMQAPLGARWLPFPTASSWFGGRLICRSRESPLAPIVRTWSYKSPRPDNGQWCATTCVRSRPAC